MPPCLVLEGTCLRPGVIREVDDDGCCGAAYDHPSKRFEFRGVDFHVGQKGGNLNEVAGLGARNRFSAYAPTDFAGPGEHVGDRFLLSVMMNSCSRSRL